MIPRARSLSVRPATAGTYRDATSFSSKRAHIHDDVLVCLVSPDDQLRTSDLTQTRTVDYQVK